MPATLAEMVEKGKRKFTAKAPRMKTNYDAAKGRMKTGYGELPFGPLTKGAYNTGIDAAVYPDMTGRADAWARGFEAGVSR